MKTIFCLLFTISLFIFSCGDKRNKPLTHQKEDKNLLQETKSDMKKDNITEIAFEEAVKEFGTPISTEEFENAKEGEVFPGIRAGIGKYYPSGTKITIKEAIWSKNDSLEIAVWYTQKQNIWLPFQYYEYDKNTDF